MPVHPRNPTALVGVARPPLAPYHPRLPSQPRVIDMEGAMDSHGPATVLLPSEHPSAFLSSYHSLRHDRLSSTDPLPSSVIASRASSRELYLESHGVMSAVNAAVNQVVDEQSATPVARVAELLGDRGVESLLAKVRHLESDLDAMLHKRSALMARLTAVEAFDERMAALESENAKSCEREALLNETIQSTFATVRQHEEEAAKMRVNATALHGQLEQQRALIEELSAKSAADEILMAQMAKDADAARARVFELEQHSRQQRQDCEQPSRQLVL